MDVGRHKEGCSLNIICCTMKWVLSVMLFAVAMASAQRFDERSDKGTIDNNVLDEASGIAASHTNANILWTHNDSGDKPRLFAMTYDAHVVGEYAIEGATNRDWEDICIGTGPKDGIQYIYVGEIGDNDAVYDTKSIYRIPEPTVSDEQNFTQQNISGAEKITFVYPDGKRDAETLMLDPITKDLYIVSKREDSVRVYRLPYPQSTTSVITAEYVVSLPLTYIVAGDISPDGREILLKNYTNVYYFTRGYKQPLKSALTQQPAIIPYEQEPQGEAICFDAKGDGFFTTSETTPLKIPAHVYYYSRATDMGVLSPTDYNDRNVNIDAIYPNPSYKDFTIKFSLQKEGKVSLDVADVKGNTISLMAERPLQSGSHSVQLSTSMLSSGTYSAKLKLGKNIVHKEFLVVK